MSLSFNCPDCGVNIHTTMYDVLRMGFACGMCERVITPAMIFREGGLNRVKELDAWIGEATRTFNRAYRDAMEWAKAEGLSPYDARVWEKINPYSEEVQKRINLAEGENYDG